jgi:hypothetical protein
VTVHVRKRRGASSVSCSLFVRLDPSIARNLRRRDNRYWSALRLSEGQIPDEYRVVGDGGDTVFVTTTIRNYNALPIGGSCWGWTAFSWTVDRSVDGGKTWISRYQTLEARRIGAARALGSLAPARQ